MTTQGTSGSTGAKVLPWVIGIAVLGVVGAIYLLWRAHFQFESILDDKRLNAGLTAATTAVGYLVKRTRTGREGQPAAAGDLRDATDDLGTQLSSDYRADAYGRGLLGPPLGLRWRPLAPADDDPPAAPGGGHDLGELPGYLAARPNRRLVVIAGPGGGKTSIGLLLSLAQIEARGARAGDRSAPVPVWFSLGELRANPRPDWPAVKECLINELNAAFEFLRYGVYGAQLAVRLIEEGYIHLVLDGVFEAADDPRGAALGPLWAHSVIEVLNQHSATATGAGLSYTVLTRPDAYQAATRYYPQLDATHIVLDPLAPPVAVDYLNRLVTDVLPPPSGRPRPDGTAPDSTAPPVAGTKADRRRRVVERLHAEPRTADGVLGSAFNVSVIGLLCRGPKDRLGNTPLSSSDSAETHLYNQAVEYTAAESGQPVDDISFGNSLRFIAARMTRTGDARLELAHLQTVTDTRPLFTRPWSLTREAAVRGLVAVGAGAAAGTLLCGLLAILGAVIHHKFFIGPVAGALCGASFGLTVGQTSESRGRRGRRLQRRIHFATGNALMAGLVTGVVLVVPFHTAYVVFAAIATSAVVGFLSSPAPYWSRRRHTWYSALGSVFARINLAVAVPVGLAVGGGLSSRHGWAYGLPAGALIGLALGRLDRASYHQDQHEQRVEDLLRSLRRWALQAAVIIAAALSVPLGVIYAHQASVTDGWTRGVIIGGAEGATMLLAATLALWWGLDDSTRLRMVCWQVRHRGTRWCRRWCGRDGGGHECRRIARGFRPEIFEIACSTALMRGNGRGGYAFATARLCDWLARTGVAEARAGSIPQRQRDHTHRLQQPGSALHLANRRGAGQREDAPDEGRW